MSSLLTEILISLVVIAVIGGIIGWLVRGAQMGHHDRELDAALRDARARLAESEEKVVRLEASMKQLNQLRRTEREKLERRIGELEPLFDIVERRDARIRELTEDLNRLQTEHEEELKRLEFDLGTRALLGDEDESAVARLKDELRLANRQRESAISRYQNQVRQIEDLQNEVAGKDRLVEELNERIAAAETGSASAREELVGELESLREAVRERDERLAELEADNARELELRDSRIIEAERRIEELDARLAEADSERRGLAAELERANDEQARLASRGQGEGAGRPAMIRAVAGDASAEASAAGNSLRMLKGIGPTTEEKLRALGVTTVEQIACLDETAIRRISESMPNFESQLRRFDWIGNARRLTGADDPVGARHSS